MRQIQMNEEIGKQIEELIQAKYYPDGARPFANSPGPYDIETSNKMVEVKACQVITINKTLPAAQKFRTGRFVVLLSAHGKLKVAADASKKIPAYVFALYQKNPCISIIDVVFLSWETVADLLASVRRYHRKKDNILIATIRHTLIFKQKRLRNE